MRIFLSESLPDYSSYTFNYALYAVQEDPLEMTRIYNRGFLPFTGNPSLESEVYYLARSLRVNLESFEDTSENRRVSRKVAALDVQLRVIEKTNFNINNPAFVKFCTDYAAERFHDGSMSAERFLYVVRRKNASHLFEFRSGTQILGYVLAVLNDEMLHYWYAFFDTQYLRSHALGKWMMWRVIKWAKDNGRQHVYLGTCYGTHALYKIRDFKGLVYWDGNQWQDDMKRLKSLCKSDQAGVGREADLFKLVADPNTALREMKF